MDRQVLACEVCQRSLLGGHWQRVRKELSEVHGKFKEKDFPSQPSHMCLEKRIPYFAPD